MALLGIAVLLLVLMPGLLYLLGWGVKRSTQNPPAWIGSLARPKRQGDTPGGKPSASIGN